MMTDSVSHFVHLLSQSGGVSGEMKFCRSGHAKIGEEFSPLQCFETRQTSLI